MKAGIFLRKFTARDGRQVILRTPRWEDLDDMLDFINSIVEEDAMILMNVKQTRDSETDWLAGNLSKLEKDRQMMIVAEVEGKMIGSCQINPKPGKSSHLWVLGISIREGYREIGIGQEIMKEMETHSSRLGIESMVLEVFAINERAIHVYNKRGYKETGRVPRAIKYRGEYVDSIIMIKHLT